jgi:hypothetical protein
MKKTLLLIIASILLLSASAQERINESKKTFLETSDILTNAIGWSYNKSKGEWFDNKNVIFYKKIESIYEYHASHTEQNFINIQVKKINSNGNVFYALFIKQWTGRWKYPSIRQDWEYNIRDKIYLFDEKEYKKIKNIKGEVDLISYYEIYFFEDVDRLTDNEIINKINVETQKQREPYLKMIFKLKEADDGSIRFLLPVTETTLKYSRDFNNEYFETTFENFNKIIID